MSTTTNDPPAARAGAREWLGLGVLGLPVFLLSIDLTVLHLALPHLSADLGATSTQQLWIMDVYGFMIAGFLITMGTLGDRIGRRRLLLIGGAAFGAASVAAAWSTSPEMLIATRALLGVAGASLMPSTLSLIRNMFHAQRQRALAIAVWGSMVASGVAVGPLVGGLMLEWFWWGSVFLLAAPVMVLLLAAGPFLLPEYRDPHPGRLDPLSVLLSLAAILSVVHAVKEAAEDGWGGPTLAVLAVGALLGWLFVRRQRRLESPLMDLTLFRGRAFSVGLTAMLLGSLIMGAFVLLFAQYLQLVQDFGPLESGLWMVPFAVANVIGSLLAPVVARRLGDRVTVALGLVISALGFVLLTQTSADGHLAPAVIASVIVAAGLSPLMVLVMNLILSSAPKERSGSASSMSETASELGAALGVATLGSMAGLVYRNSLTGELPSDLPVEAAAVAQESLPNATAVAGELPAGSAEALLSPAREAFVAGLAAIGYTSAALLTALAVTVVLLLRTSLRQDQSTEPRAHH